MTELTVGIWNVILESKDSLLRTLIYTIGHFVIAITCLMLIADVPLAVAVTDAIVEPIANSVLYFVLDKLRVSREMKEKIKE